MSDKFVSPTARAAIEVFARAGLSPSAAFRVLQAAGERVSLSTCYRLASQSGPAPGTSEFLWYASPAQERPGA